jgi:hypothetical protein
LLSNKKHLSLIVNSIPDSRCSYQFKNREAVLKGKPDNILPAIFLTDSQNRIADIQTICGKNFYCSVREKPVSGSAMIRFSKTSFTKTLIPTGWSGCLAPSSNKK